MVSNEHYKPGDRVVNLDWDPDLERGALGTVVADPAEGDPEQVVVAFDGDDRWTVERTGLAQILDPEKVHRFPGSDPARRTVGVSGHCDTCAVSGHLQAHPERKCLEVGCDWRFHPDEALRW